MQSRNRDTDVKKCMITKRESRVGMNWEIGVEIDWLPWWFSGKEFTCQCRRSKFNPQVRKSPWRKKWQLTPVSLPGESHGQRSLSGCSPWGHKELDMTEQLHFHFLSWKYRPVLSSLSNTRAKE